MSMSMSLYAIDSWADINAEIRLNERKLSEGNETILSELYLMREKSNVYGAQNEAYMSRLAEKWVRGLCFNELGVGG